MKKIITTTIIIGIIFFSIPLTKATAYTWYNGDDNSVTETGNGSLRLQSFEGSSTDISKSCQKFTYTGATGQVQSIDVVPQTSYTANTGIIFQIREDGTATTTIDNNNLLAFTNINPVDWGDYPSGNATTTLTGNFVNRYNLEYNENYWLCAYIYNTGESLGALNNIYFRNHDTSNNPADWDREIDEDIWEAVGTANGMYFKLTMNDLYSGTLGYEQLNWLFPSTNGEYPEFGAFEFSYGNFVQNAPYTIIVRYGTASSTIADPTAMSGYGWDTWIRSIYRHANWPLENGTIKINTGINTGAFAVSTSTSYYARAYVYAGDYNYPPNPGSVLASTDLLTLTFNENASIDNQAIGFEDQFNIDLGIIEYDEQINASPLRNKFPFAYFYDIGSALGAVGSMGTSTPTLALNFSSGSINFATSTVISQSSLTTFFGSNNWNLAMAMVEAFLWLTAGWYIFNRIKTII